MIKEYADRIREEIKSTQISYDIKAEQWVENGREWQYRKEDLRYLKGKEDGLNKALDIYLDLVKEDL